MRVEAAAETGSRGWTPRAIGSPRRTSSAATRRTSAPASAPTSLSSAARRNSEVEVDELIRAPGDRDDREGDDEEEQRSDRRALEEGVAEQATGGGELCENAGEELLG